jgi:integrase
MRGSIRKRAKGSWTLTVYLGRDPVTGKKRQLYRTVRGSKKQAEAALAQLVHAVETGMDLDSSRLTVSEYLDKWLEVAGRRVKRRTHERYADLIRLHVKPVIGQLMLRKLRPLHLERVYEEAQEKGLAPQTVVHVHRVVYSALRQAVRWQLIVRNVAEAVISPRASRRDIPPLEPADVGRLLAEVAGTDLLMPVLLALGTGMRRGEVLGLRWYDVDLETGIVRITQTLQSDMTFDTPKSHRSRRSITLPPPVVEALKRHRKVQNERRLRLGDAWQELDLVIDRGDGGPIAPYSLSQRFRTASARAGVDVNFHGLRHGHASLMLALGIDIKVRSERLGHSTIAITGDLYDHVASDLDREAAAKIGELLAPLLRERAE